MRRFRLLSAPEQAAAWLRAQIEQGIWGESMPPAGQLATEMGVNHKTIEAALRQLEHEGVLQGQGRGRRTRKIVASGKKSDARLRVGLLLYERTDFDLQYIVQLRHALADAGHAVVMNEKTIEEFRQQKKSVSRLVRPDRADAWVVTGGPQELLGWLSSQPAPIFALFGRREGLPVAGIGPDKRAAMLAAMRRLAQLGHRRIVKISRSERRLPTPGLMEKCFLDELRNLGLPAGEYNLPNWDDTPEGLQTLLSSLFRITPPTALIMDTAGLFVAANEFMAMHGIKVPQQVSMICTDSSPAFQYCRPAISHIRWDSAPLVHRIVQWATNVSRGVRDVTQTLLHAEFVEGGTIGPAPGRT